MATNSAPLSSSSTQTFNGSSLPQQQNIYFFQNQISVNVTVPSLPNLNTQTKPPKNMATNSAPSNNSSTQYKFPPSPSPSLSTQSTKRVEKFFNHFDSDSDGDSKFSFKELGASLRSSFSAEDELRRLQDEFDSDHDGSISVTEFAAFGRSTSLEEAVASSIRDAFNIFEQDQNGSELRDAFKLYDEDQNQNGPSPPRSSISSSNRLGKNFCVEDCHRLIRSIDSYSDGNGNASPL